MRILQIALDDAGWTSLASMVASVTAVVVVLINNRRGSVIEQKVDATKHSVTTPNGDPRTLAEIVSEAHPAEDEAPHV